MSVRVALAVALPLLWSNAVVPRLPEDMRVRTLVNAGAATGYAAAFGAHPNWCSARGWRYGLGSAGIVAAGYGAALAIPAVRRELAERPDRAPGVSTAEWVGVHIPLGTVYSEELIFRATLDPLLDKTFGPPVATLLGATTFGLWHIAPARATEENLPVTIAVTTAAGALFGLLRRHTGSATTPALLHWAINAGGALAARFAARTWC
ncbi:CPBP family intramembrane glutamic endopeptidase [Nocardia cyriacigeorgica]|uniref:CPBP family intramembrane glutamic endopeptidase n=1 Tax=Nocardia cyriacigeorgica TaxID=135487 RepID=UPI001893267A|nr:CPBP family intramembrane glutamic endopeptidase [Nocardia cyriacigeorgica]MBF6456297.1 CPBP family intramembrane metalloprotease [Nocardia cyriacigeorgica]MBF6477369.1 CPBP family intramembrane metalloprotease [Nocardia cyriacigeorgica]MBF6551103.1 CPBP family intramembrane metalloprotease [Nocardia cyriacigeorgica]